MDEKNEQSSEMTDEEKLAQEALDATAEGGTSPEETSPTEEPEQNVPVAKHAALRKRAQTAEIGKARAEGALAALTEQRAHDAPPSKSPLDLEIERQAAEGIAEEDMTISPKVIRANDRYNEQVANQKAEKAAREKLATVQVTSANKAKAAHEDWSEVILAGDALLTRGELLDLSNAGVDFGELAYAISKAAIERNKPDSETTAPNQSKSETEKKAEAEAKAKAEAEKVSTRDEILKDADPDTARVAQL